MYRPRKPKNHITKYQTNPSQLCRDCLSAKLAADDRATHSNLSDSILLNSVQWNGKTEAEKLIMFSSSFGSPRILAHSNGADSMSQEPGQSGATASAGEQAQTEEVNNATRSTPRKRRASSSSDASDDEVGRLFTNRHGAEKFWLHTSCEDVPNLIKAIKAGGGDIVTMRKDAHFSLFPNKWELPDAHEAARKKSQSNFASTRRATR